LKKTCLRKKRSRSLGQDGKEILDEPKLVKGIKSTSFSRKFSKNKAGNTLGSEGAGR